MNIKSIILLVLLGVAIAAVVSTYSDASKSSTFKVADANVKESFHIEGKLLKDKPIEYNPSQDANRFTFYLEDKDGTVKKVISSEPKVQDFERSETVNMNGYSNGTDFIATKVIPKCPSKYKDEEANKQKAAQQASGI